MTIYTAHGLRAGDYAVGPNGDPTNHPDVVDDYRQRQWPIIRIKRDGTIWLLTNSWVQCADLRDADIKAREFYFPRK